MQPAETQDDPDEYVVAISSATRRSRSSEVVTTQHGAPKPIRTSRPTWILIGLLACCVAVMAVAARDPSFWHVFVAASLTAGGLVVLIWRRADVRMSVVVALAVVFRLAFVGLPPVLSDDAYRYVWDGFIQTQGVNPYLHPPEAAALADYQDEPVYQELNSAAYYSVYPPLSQLIFRIGGYFYQYGWQVSYYVIKGMLATLEFGAVIVLAQVLGPAALLLYAWNPLVLIAGAGQAHGEAALALFFALTLWAARRGRGGEAAVWLACAGWVKLYPFVLFPLLWRRFGWKSAAFGIVAAVALAMPFAHPAALSNVWSSLDLYVRFFEFNAGFYYLVKETFEIITSADWSKQIGPAFRLTYLLLLPAIYLLDWRAEWTLERGFAVVIGAYLVFSTTVHPWYLLGILVVVAASPGVAWHWHWLSVLSIGTYMLYVGGPYWIWVVLGWIGWVGFATFRHGRAALDALMRFRARGKADLVAPFLSRTDRVLDIGAAEGFVAERLVQARGVDAELVDVVPLNRTDLSHRVYDGMNLPYADDAFDVTILVYVLHHSEDPSRVIQEAVRVAARRVIVIESTYARSWEHRLLRLIDHSLNAVRSLGRMDRETLHFRQYEEWIELFDDLGIRVAARRYLGGFIHHRALYVLDAMTPDQTEK